MFKSIKISLVLLFLITNVLILQSNANTITAKSCSQSDVQNAVNAASHGDIVIVPAGRSSWSNDLDVSVGITLQGAGIGKTILTRTGDSQLVDLEVGHNLPVRVTGFTFIVGSSGYGLYMEANSGSYRNKSVRIDHNRFEGGQRSILSYDWIYGVIDNNTFYNAGSSSVVTLYGDGQNSWDRGGDVGTENAMFIENNSFVWDRNNKSAHCITSNKGARYVFRYNSMTTDQVNSPSGPVDAHGYCSVNAPGTYLYEIYENSFTIQSGGSIYRAMHIRGGRGVIFNNTYNGQISSGGYGIFITNYRSNDAGCATATCQGVNHELCRDNEGYPCQNQINNLYIWNNTHNGKALAINRDSGYDVPKHVQEGRDYFLTEKPNYNRFTYPHPLTGAKSEQPGTPNAPSSLKIVQ